MNLIEKFSSELKKVKAPKPYSDKTIENYCEDVKQLLKYTQKSPEDVTEKEVDAFLDENSAATSRRRYSGLRKFYEMLVSDGILAINPVRKRDKTELRQDPDRITERMTIPEGLRFLEESKKKIKNHAMMSTFLNTGIRESELFNLTRGDFCIDEYPDGHIEASLHLIGKGDKERFVAVPSEIVEIIQKYLAQRKDDSDLLFITNRGTKYNGTAMYNLVNNIAKRAGINKKISPHKLRHTFASMMWENGADPLQIMEILGHSDIQTTMRYLGKLGMKKAQELANRSAFNVK